MQLQSLHSREKTFQNFSVPVEVDDSALKKRWARRLEQLGSDAREEVLALLDRMKDYKASAEAFRAAIFRIHAKCGNHFVRDVVASWAERNEGQFSKRAEGAIWAALEWTAAE